VRSTLCLSTYIFSWFWVIYKFPLRALSMFWLSWIQCLALEPCYSQTLSQQKKEHHNHVMLEMASCRWTCDRWFFSSVLPSATTSPMPFVAPTCSYVDTLLATCSQSLFVHLSKGGNKCWGSTLCQPTWTTPTRMREVTYCPCHWQYISASCEVWISPSRITSLPTLPYTRRIWKRNVQI